MSVQTAGLATDVIYFHVTIVVLNMDNVKTVLVFAHKGGMENIALCVSYCWIELLDTVLIGVFEFDRFVVLISAGCKNACSRHGMCSLEDGEYHCVCIDAWAGDDCSIPLEQECNDETDNDNGEC